MRSYRPPSMGNIPTVVKNLLILNVIMFLGTLLMQQSGFDLNSKLGLYFYKSDNFRIYQYVTHMFMHGGFAHIFFNMFALWMFGRVLENVWGPKRFLIYYFVTGLGAAALHTLANWYSLGDIQTAAIAFSNTPSPDLFAQFIKEYIPNPNPKIWDFINDWSNDAGNPEFINQAIYLTQSAVDMKLNVPTVGASGAVFGVLLAFGMLFPNTQLMLLFPPIPIKILGIKEKNRITKRSSSDK
jgi:rhomboid family protein